MHNSNKQHPTNLPCFELEDEDRETHYTFTVIGADRIDVAEWRGYDIVRVTSMRRHAARKHYKALRAQGYARTGERSVDASAFVGINRRLIGPVR